MPPINILAVSKSFAFIQSSTICSSAASRHETSVISLASCNDILFALSNRRFAPFDRSTCGFRPTLSALAVATEHILIILLSVCISSPIFDDDREVSVGAFEDLLNNFMQVLRDTTPSRFNTLFPQQDTLHHKDGSIAGYLVEAVTS